MKTQSGWLNYTKREEEAMRCALQHLKQDMSYGGGGTFTDGTNENNLDEKDYKKAKKGVELIEWILAAYK